MNIVVILKQKNVKWQYCTADSHIGTALRQYQSKAFGMLCRKRARNRKMLPMRITLHLASFIFTRPMISASGITSTKAEMGVRNSRRVNSISTGKRMSMDMR